ncbi:Uncharacterised protein [Raoultella planticola]|uniref:Uncharacterized protein n=1 Tax=Raoultella planticola TaxID=575 RepID=A0A485ALT6_RAOPL|nr:Uncharacterised protein [Raoultella planticola]
MGDGRKCTFFRLDHKMLQRPMRATNRPLLPGLRTDTNRSPGKRRASRECSWMTEDELFAARPVREEQRCTRGLSGVNLPWTGLWCGT